MEKLESLLKTFVTEDKLRQEARFNLLNKRSASLTNLNAFDPNEVDLCPLPQDEHLVSLYSGHHHLLHHNKKSSGSNNSTTNITKQGARKIVNKMKTNSTLTPTSANQSENVYGKVRGTNLPTSHYLHGPGSRLKQARSQEDLRLSNEVERLLSGLSDWSPKSRYIQLMAEKSGLLNNKSGLKKTNSDPSHRPSQSSLTKSDTNKNQPNFAKNQSSNRSTIPSVQNNKGGLVIRSASRSPERNSVNQKTINSNATPDVIKQVRSKGLSPSQSSTPQTELSNNEKESKETRSRLSNNRSPSNVSSNQKVAPKSTGKETKSMEQILADALKLTEDEKATLIATRENSLATKLAKQRIEESNKSSIESSCEKASKLPENDKNLPAVKTIEHNGSQSSQRGTVASMKAGESREEKPKDEGRFRDSLFSSPVNYAKNRFAASRESTRNSSESASTEGNSAEASRQSVVNEAKQAWERKASNQNLDKQGHFRHGSNAFSNPWYASKGETGAVNGSNALTRPDKVTTTIHRTNPVRPFLTKGSVAERVLLFERRPEMKKDGKSNSNDSKSKSPVLYSTWKNQDKTQSEVLQIAQNFIQPTTNRQSATTISRNSWGTGYGIPRFYFPSGLPYTSTEIDARIRRIVEEFNRLPDRSSTRESFGKITKAAGLPLYWKQSLFDAVIGESRKSLVTCDQFVKYFKDLVTSCHDDTSKFVRVYSHGKRNYLLPEDFVPMMQDVIETHPGLGFLKEATEFHSRYVQTVIARIFYCVNKSWSGRISIPELRKSNFLLVVSLLEEEDDINQITDYFSYEHFYVIYCKFWELDKDHDLIIDREDLMRHNDAAISSRMIDRIFSGAVTRGPVRRQGKMTYSEFVWFLISEEDKRYPRAIEYWFRCMDIDGDGYLSMYELEYFYEEQVKRMEALGIEALPFNDCLCQMLDMVRPKECGRISLADLKRCRMTPIFFDTFFNLDKYLDHEQRDPFSSKDNDDAIISDWDRFAAEEYELLVAEESAQQSRIH
uniref:EF-hand domain-containing protein n=1 Tax=Tetranychus urticae TaxID=32264 RepID=T1L299_TETUR